MLIVGVPLQQIRFDHLRPRVLAKLHFFFFYCDINTKNFLNFSSEFSCFDTHLKMSTSSDS